MTEAKSAHIAADDDNDCTTAVKCVNCEKNAIEAKEHNFTKAVYDESHHWFVCANEGCEKANESGVVTKRPTVKEATYGVSFSEYAENLFDGDQDTKWCTDMSYMYGENPYVIFDFDIRVKIRSYTLTIGNDTEEYIGRNWKKWTIYATNDSNYADWTVIHSVSDGNLPVTNYEVSDPFYVNSEEGYRYYKLEVEERVGGGEGNEVQQMAELTFDVIQIVASSHYGEEDTTYVQKDADNHKKICVCGYQSDESHTRNDNCICEFCGDEVHSTNNYPHPCECSYCNKIIHSWGENCTCSRCSEVFHGNIDSNTGICGDCEELRAAASVVAGGVKIYYTTFDEALIAAMEIEDSIIVLENDCAKQNSSLDMTKGKITIDLNGKKLGSNVNYLFSSAKGNLTIKDSVGGGETTADISVDIGTLTIEGGSHESILACETSTVTVKGGNISYFAINSADAIIDIYGGSFDSLTFYETIGPDTLLVDGYAYYDINGNVVDTDSLTVESHWYSLSEVTVGEIR